MSAKHTPKFRFRAGKCPYCGSPDLEYGPTDWADNQEFQEISCCSCGLSYQEWSDTRVSYIFIHAQELNNAGHIEEADIEIPSLESTLLAALEAMLKLDNRDNGEYMADAITDMARAAIEKVKGENK